MWVYKLFPRISSSNHCDARILPALWYCLSNVCRAYIALSYQYQHTYTTKYHFFFGIDAHIICVYTVYCVYMYHMYIWFWTSTLQVVLRVDHVTLSSVRTVLFPSPHITRRRTVQNIEWGKNMFNLWEFQQKIAQKVWRAKFFWHRTKACHPWKSDWGNKIA